MVKKDKILVLGGSGLVGSSVTKHLRNLDSCDVFSAKRVDADLFSLKETNDLIEKFKPDYIINCAAKVGGILANNTYRTEFILENLKINVNVLESLINKPQISLINLGSSCIYPLNAENPISEDSLMTGKLEPTNSPYAMAKLTAIEMGNSLQIQYGHKIINLMPTNLYGPNDNFSPENSHVIPGLMHRLHKSKIENNATFEVWGTGTPLREFLHVDDLSSCISHLIKMNVDSGLYNVGSGEEISIKGLVDLLKEIVGFKGEILFNTDFPDGNPRKLLNSEKIFNTGWKPQKSLKNGLDETYKWYLENISL